MTDIDRVYKITIIEVPELVDIKGLDRSFFEQLQTITEITEHKIEAQITKNRRKEPNQAELTIYNLAFATREQLVRGPMQVRIEAGYDGLLRLLFLGDARYVSNAHDGTNWLTKIQLGDGARAYAQAFVNRTYQPGTPLTTIIGHMCKSFGVPVPREITSAPELQGRVPTGEAFVGKTADSLTDILAEFGFEWFFLDGRLRIVKAEAAFPGTIRVISEGDGMIGTPVIDPPKIRAPAKAGSKSKARPRVPKLTVQNTLFPELVPAEKFQLQSASLNGRFIIDKLQHELDSFGGDWKTTIEATEAT